MNSFEESFSFLAIVRVLATLRAKEAGLRHRKVFYWRHFGGDADPGLTKMSGVSALLPPRRQWSRPSRKMRGGKGRPLAQILRDAIYRKVQGVAAAGRLDEFEWGRRLQRFVAEVQERIAKEDYAFERPRLWLRPKAVPIAGKTKCRCICCYEKLSDRVILALANKWLASVVDPKFADCCYSFRSTRKLTYTTAVRKLVAYRKAHAGRLYAADCDVMKFFDTVGHDVVRAETAKMLSKVEGGDSFLRLLDGYLSSYSLGWMLDEGRKLVVHENYVLDSVDVARIVSLHEGRVVDLERLGLPQGGALSGTLANVILNEVDRAVMSSAIDDLFYARYCDDIILAHGREDECNKALGIVRTALEQVKVPIHPVQRTVSYGAGYYEAKSKGPYAWERQTPQARNAVPWVSFLGCCVRYDGELRIRKETVLGHAQSMAEECETFCKRVKAARNKAGRHTDGVWYEDAVRGLMYRLVDKGAGRVTGTTGHGIGRCWLAAFPIAWMSPPAQQQLRQLDRIRTDLFTAVKRELGLMLKKGDPKSGEEPSLYFGKPFSYAGIAERLVRAQVARLRTVTFDVMPVSDSQDFITHDGDQNEPRSVMSSVGDRGGQVF